ncbi:hypothetical protein HMPREF9075_01145 [Capnocytophaga sp. oral taxon 332 str. F0381]|nr:hypothetical protein HMPREF9075_01145 [Capnocytophaga sp. oral taxon 332 str. F0381]
MFNVQCFIYHIRYLANSLFSTKESRRAGWKINLAIQNKILTFVP